MLLDPQGIKLNDRENVMQLNHAAIEQIRNLPSKHGSLLGRLIDIYLEESPKILHRMERAVRLRQRHELEISAHTLKSSSAQLGGTEFAETCLRLEAFCGKNLPFVDAGPLYDQAASEYELLEELLSELREELT